MNEYLQKFNALQEKNTFRGQQWFGERNDLVEEYSWAIPGEEAVMYLSEFDELVEVGAGNGYWAHCINNAGGRVMPYDIDPPDDTWTSVEQKDVVRMSESCFEYPVLTVWPPLREKVASHIARKNPPHILYVGEPKGGCTGEDGFFNILTEKYGLVSKIDIPSYAGIHDDLYHYIRKV